MKKVMRRFNERFHPNDSIGYAYGIHHDTANLHVHVAICPRTENGSYVGCSTSRSIQSKHKKQMDCIKSWFEIENSALGENSQLPTEIGGDAFQAPRRRQVGLFAEAESPADERAAVRPKFRLDSGCSSSTSQFAIWKHHWPINGEHSAVQHDSRFVSRLLGHRQSRATQLVAKIGTAVERRSLRELQSLLFKLKRQYRTLHKRYSQIYGFSSYAHRNAISYHASMRQQNAL